MDQDLKKAVELIEKEKKWVMLGSGFLEKLEKSIKLRKYTRKAEERLRSLVRALSRVVRREFRFEQKFKKIVAKLRQSNPEYNEQLHHLEEKITVYENKVVSKLSDPWFGEEGTIVKLVKEKEINWDLLEQEVKDVSEQGFTSLLSLLKEMEHLLRKFKIDISIPQKNRELFFKELWGSILACEDACHKKIEFSKLSITASKVGVAALNGAVYVARNLVGEVAAGERAYHAEFNLATKISLAGKIICVSDQPCFQEEEIEIVSQEKDQIQGRCVKTNYVQGKTIFPFDLEMINEGSRRRISTVKWDKGSKNRSEFDFLCSARKNGDLTVIWEYLDGTWIPVEEIEMKNGKLVRRWGCAVTLAHLGPKEIIYAFDEEKVKLYSGCKKYLIERGIFAELIDNERLNFIAGILKLDWAGKDKASFILDQLKSMLISVGKLSEEDYAHYLVERFFESVSKIPLEPQRRLLKLQEWLENSHQSAPFKLLRNNIFRLRPVDNNIALRLLS